MSAPRDVPSPLDVLRSLAEEQATYGLDELLKEARFLTEDPEDLQELEQAILLGTSVLDRLSEAQEREAALIGLVDSARELARAGTEGVGSVLRTAARAARRTLRSDVGCVALVDPASGDLTVVASEGDVTAFNLGLRMAGPSGLGQAALTKGAPFSTHDYLTDPTIEHATEIDRVVRAEGTRAIVAVPLQGASGPIGVLYASHRQVRRFTAREINSLSTLASLAAPLISTADTVESLGARKAALEEEENRTWQEIRTQRRLEAAYDHLLTLVHDGSGLDTVVEVAAVALDGALAVRDLKGNTLASHGHVPAYSDDQFLQRCLDAVTADEPVLLDDGVWIAPACGNGETLGTVLFLPGTPLTGQRSVRPLQVISRLLTVAVLLERSAALAEGGVRNDLLEALLAPPHSRRPQRQLDEQAQRLGIDPGGPHVLVLVCPDRESLQRVSAWSTFYAHRKRGLKGARNGCTMLLLPGDDASAAAHGAHDELSRLLKHPVTVCAAGPYTGLTRVPQLYEDARRCLDALTELGSSGVAATPQDLGFLGLLLADAFTVPGYVDSVIGPVLRYDAQRFTELARTLETYFASGASPRRAAKALHVHPNTVARRLERIGELLGLTWQEPARALEIQLALRLHRTLRTLHGRRAGSAHAESDSC
ncbi:helix-turn-helix domain-containing protein [Streptomyces luteireticuli]|uniref:Helix-turn-helix domain-containing protein n=1 Tax=Streptomyces luteireticuli TaxID=173858 RepID=A0ABN0YKE5_9ACTN